MGKLAVQTALFRAPHRTGRTGRLRAIHTEQLCVKGASALSIIRRVHQSSSVFAGRLPAGQPHAGPPSLSSCAATATQPIQPICTNSARWSRLSAYHTVVVASSPRSPKAIDMLPSLSWLDRAQRLVVMMHCPMWDFLRTFFSFDAQRCWVAGCGLLQSL